MVAAKESRRPKVTRLPGTKILPLVKANGRAIGVGMSLGMLTVPLASAPTIMVPKTEGTVEFRDNCVSALTLVSNCRFDLLF